MDAQMEDISGEDIEANNDVIFAGESKGGKAEEPTLLDMQRVQAAVRDDATQRPHGLREMVQAAQSAKAAKEPKKTARETTSDSCYVPLQPLSSHPVCQILSLHCCHQHAAN